MAQRILVILGHPSEDSLSAALAQSYKEGAQAAGAQVRLLDLGALAFDPILRAGYRGEQALEPDLQAAQAQITWAEHLVWVYPTWWGAMPALLNLNNRGQSWVENGVSHARVVARIGPPIREGCPALWTYLEARLAEAQAAGWYGMG
mgnify:CR=1 FL=1